MIQEALDIFIEINSLNKQIIFHQKNITQIEQRRSDFYQKLEEVKQKQINTLSTVDQLLSERSEFEKQLSQKDQQYKQALQHLQLATSNKQMNTSEQEIKHLQAEITQLEDNILQSLDDEEQHKKNLEQYKLEEQGLKQSVIEIDNECNQQQQKERQEINNYEERINQLKMQLSNDQLRLFMDLQRLAPPITPLKNHHCATCMMQLPAQVEQQIFALKQFEFCPGCGRLFIPKEL